MESIPSLRLCEFIHRISFGVISFDSTGVLTEKRSYIFRWYYVCTDVRTAYYISALSALVLSA